jgi:hypothetical protein
MILCLSAPVALAETATRAHLDAVEDPPGLHLSVAMLHGEMRHRSGIRWSSFRSLASKFHRSNFVRTEKVR